MKARTLTLAALLLAGATTAAMAQEGRGHGHGGGGGDGGQPAPQTQPGPAPQAQPAPQARPAPQAQPAPAGGRPGEWRGAHGGQPTPPDGAGRFGGRAPHLPGQYGSDQHGPERRGPDQRGPGPAVNPAWSGPGGERQNWNGREGGERRDWNGRPGGERRDWADHPGGPRPPGNGPYDPRGGYGDRRDHAVAGSDVGRWAPHRYPPSYRSDRRYHALPWRAPRGYYARAWRYGEILPYGWYGPDYRILEFWQFGLPEPPPGYYWVRVGYDALLVDDFDGRIVQVVRYLFW
jgi:Ni/Co efflux regulator RcnB